MLFGRLICAVKDSKHSQITGAQELSLPRMLKAAREGEEVSRSSIIPFPGWCSPNTWFSTSLRAQVAAWTLFLSVAWQATSSRNLVLDGYLCPLSTGRRNTEESTMKRGRIRCTCHLVLERKSCLSDSHCNCGSSQAPDLCKFVLYPVVHATGKPNPAVQK